MCVKNHIVTDVDSKEMFFFFFLGFGEGDRSMREDREDRDAYRRGPMEGGL